MSKLNAFDFVVTVTLGASLAAILLSRDVSLAEVILALALLVALRYAVAVTDQCADVSARSAVAPVCRPLAAVAETAEGPADHVAGDGRLRERTVCSARVAESEIRQAARSQGTGDIHDLAAVVLETDGGLSVITRGQLGDGSALVDVRDEGR